MSSYNIVASMSEHTIVAEYVAEYRRSEEYQSEAELEKSFIRDLEAQGYEYLTIRSEAELIANLRRQLETLNE